jgi:hypothetical protein
VKTAPVDAEKLRAIVGEAVKEAEANDPKRLRAEVSRLQAELAKLSKSAPAADPKALHEAGERGYAAALRAVQPIADRLGTLADAFAETVGGLQADLRRLSQQQPKASALPPASRTMSHKVEANYQQPPPRRQSTDSSLTAGQRNVLTAIAQHPAGVTREQLSVLTGYKRSSRDTYLQQLRSETFIEYEGERIVATSPGRDALGDGFTPLPTGDALRKHWISTLPQGERVVLEVVLNGFPGWVEREAISTATGYLRSSRDTYLQKLAARQLITTDRGRVQASEALFDA